LIPVYSGLTQQASTGVLGRMTKYLLLSGGLLCVLTGSACAAQDVDLLTYDPIPQKKESSAPPVDVLPPEVRTYVAPEPAAPLAESQPAAAPPPPVSAAILPPSKPQPPVDVAKPLSVKPTQKKQEAVAKPAPVKSAPPASKVVPTPAVRPVLKVTEPALKPAPAEQAPPAQKEMMKHAGPKAVVVPPPTLNAEIEPLPAEVLHDKAPHRIAVQEKAIIEPPPAPEPSVKVKDPVIQSGDPIRIEVAGEGDLSGWYKVSPEGSIMLPIIGKVRAQGFTHAKLAEILTDTLKDGYLVNPVVTVTGKATP
jgi:hypothetical protein